MEGGDRCRPPVDGRASPRETGSGHRGQHGGRSATDLGAAAATDRSSSRQGVMDRGGDEGKAERPRRRRPGTHTDFRRGAPAAARGREG